MPTDAKLRTAKPSPKPYKLSDGHQLYLLVTPSGTVRPNAPLVRGGRVRSADAPPAQTSQPVPLLQYVARGDPPGGDDVCSFSASLRNVEDLLFERGIDICHETVRMWWNRFGPMFAGDIRRQRVSAMHGFRHWRWHLDEMYVKLNGEMVYLWRAVDHEGETLESYITKTRDKAAALTFIKKALKRHGSPAAITTDGLRSYRAAMKDLGNEEKQEIGRWANNRVENSHLPFRRRERAMLRFRRMKTLQKFASVHANVHNHFNLERHLVDRPIYKERRSAALAGWQLLAS